MITIASIGPTCHLVTLRPLGKHSPEDSIITRAFTTQLEAVSFARRCGPAINVISQDHVYGAVTLDGPEQREGERLEREAQDARIERIRQEYFEDSSDRPLHE